VVRNRGFRVAEMSEADLDQISQIRFLLEVPSTAQVAATITTERLDALAAVADEIEAAAARGDLIGYLDADRRFHVELISTLENPRLTESSTGSAVRPGSSASTTWSARAASPPQPTSTTSSWTHCGAGRRRHA